MTTMTPSNKALIVPDWPVPLKVRALQTTRLGGVSRSPYASLNLGDHVGDDRSAVAANRALLRESLAGGGEPVWLEQVHGTRVVDAAEHLANRVPPQADAAFSRQSGVCCAVMTADCLPVLFAEEGGSALGAAHAGWRGLAAGVLENTVVAMGAPASRITAWLGPAAGPQAYEIGEEVFEAFVTSDASAASAFIATRPGHWRVDLYRLARQRLAAIGLTRIHGGDLCTISDPQRFYSHRRDARTGRMASVIWRTQ